MLVQLMTYMVCVSMSITGVLRIPQFALMNFESIFPFFAPVRMFLTGGPRKTGLGQSCFPVLASKAQTWLPIEQR